MTGGTDDVAKVALSYEIDPLKYIGNLQEFDGTRDELKNFIEAVDRIVPVTTRYDAAAHQFFISAIRRKIKGEAQKVLNIHSNISNWSEIKLVLENNFVEKKTSEQIYDELRDVEFRRTVLDFYNDIRSILSRLNEKIQYEGVKGDELKITVSSNNRKGLEIFKNRLGDPMYTVLQCRNPKNLEEAIRILGEGNYLNRISNKYIKNKTEFVNKAPQRFNKPLLHNNNPQIKTNFRNSEQNNYRFNRPQNYSRQHNNYGRPEAMDVDPSTNYNRNTYRLNRPPNNSRQLNYNYGRAEAMDVDPSMNSRFQVNTTENFPLGASNNNFRT